MEQHETVWKLFNELATFLNTEALQPYFALGSYIEAMEALISILTLNVSTCLMACTFLKRLYWIFVMEQITN